MAVTTSTSVAIEIERCRPFLPAPLEFLDLGGLTVFPVYGASGGPSTEMLSILKNGPWDCEDCPMTAGFHDLGAGRKAFVFRWTRGSIEQLDTSNLQAQIQQAVKELTNA